MCCPHPSASGPPPQPWLLPILLQLLVSSVPLLRVFAPVLLSAWMAPFQTLFTELPLETPLPPGDTALYCTVFLGLCA